MLPYVINKEKVKRALAAANSCNIILPDFLQTPQFDALLEACIECNEMHEIQFLDYFGRLYCAPMVFFHTEKNREALIELEHPEVFGIPIRDFGTLPMPHRRIEFKHRKYWEPKDFLDIEKLSQKEDAVEIIDGMLVIAQRVLARSPGMLGIVCGPISSGPNSVTENLRIFNRTLFKVAHVIRVFNQMPFESAFARVHTLIHQRPELMANGSSSKFFIDRFYSKLFTCGKQWKAHFINRWDESIGASIEYDIFSKDHTASLVKLGEGYEKLLL